MCYYTIYVYFIKQMRYEEVFMQLFTLMNLGELLNGITCSINVLRL